MVNPKLGTSIYSPNFGFLISAPSKRTRRPDKAKVAARFTDINVFPSSGKVDVTNTVLASPSGTLFNINSKLVLTIRMASAELVLLSDFINSAISSEVGTSPINGICVFPSRSSLLLILVSNTSSM